MKSLLVLGAAMAVVVGSAWAQVPARGTAPRGGTGTAEEGKVSIRRFPPASRPALVRTPQYSANVSGLQSKLSGGRPREWAVFEVQYDTSAKWTDELAFTYHIMTLGKDEEGKEAYSYYTLTVRYIDIPAGPHMSCVMLPPSLVERYGEPVSIALEIMGKSGAVLESKSDSKIPYPSKEWWKDPQVMDSAQVKRRPGLVDRSKTPFALINADDYEVVQ